VFLGEQLALFGGFNGEFLNDMYYAKFVYLENDSKIDETYVTDTIKCINNSFRSNIHFIVQGEFEKDIIYSHTYMLIYKLMSLIDDLDCEYPQIMHNIAEEYPNSSTENPIVIFLPKGVKKEHLIYLLGKCLF
jgi:hypothetical protein